MLSTHETIKPGTGYEILAEAPVIYEQRPEGNERALANRTPGKNVTRRTNREHPRPEATQERRPVWPGQPNEGSWTRGPEQMCLSPRLPRRLACTQEADEKPVQDSELRIDKVWITFQKDHCWAKAGRQFSRKDGGGLALAQTQAVEWRSG